MTNVQAPMTKSLLAFIGHWDLVLGHFFMYDSSLKHFFDHAWSIIQQEHDTIFCPLDSAPRANDNGRFPKVRTVSMWENHLRKRMMEEG
jgi:hypothetical protein